MTSDDGKPFDQVTLAELCDETRGITYGIVKVGEFVPDGIPVVRGGDIRDNRIGIDDEKRVSDEVSRRFRRTVLRGGEIVLNLIADPGHSAIVPASLAGANVTRDVAVIPVTRADTRFVNYFLQSPQCIGWLRAHLQGSVTLKINLGTLASLPVPKPPIVEQRRIASVLRALDDKIDSNRRLAGLLQETAAALFRARFVDFVGVEEFEDTEIGRIPRGWSAGSLADLARFVNGKAFTKHANGLGRAIVRIRELNGGVDENTPRTDLDADDDFVARFDDILFAWSGSLGVHRWHGEEALINQHIFKVRPDRGPSWFVYAWIQQHIETFRGIARDKATTMGHIQRRHLAEAAVPQPPESALQAANEILGPIDRQRAMLVSEMTTLASIRDALLPKLLSGEIRMPDSTDPAEVIEPMVA
jgi:type I restriction enzyme, S subunit